MDVNIVEWTMNTVNFCYDSQTKNSDILGIAKMVEAPGDFKMRILPQFC
jgi:hypothetical protein